MWRSSIIVNREMPTRSKSDTEVKKVDRSFHCHCRLIIVIIFYILLVLKQPHTEKMRTLVAVLVLVVLLEIVYAQETTESPAELEQGNFIVVSAPKSHTTKTPKTACSAGEVKFRGVCVKLKVNKTFTEASFRSFIFKSMLLHEPERDFRKLKELNYYSVLLQSER